MRKRTSIYIDGFKHSNPIPAACVLDHVLMSGLIVGVDPETGRMPATLGEQCSNMYTHMRKIVEAAGGGLDDIVKVTVWMNDRTMRDAINPGWIALFPDAASRPARATLNGNLGGGKLIEAEIIAILPPNAG